MSSDALTSSLKQTLEGWKDIAAHLGVQVRTAQRWEKTLGLPVRRVPGHRKPRVLADTAELESWLVRDDRPKLIEDERTHTRRRRWVMLAAGGLTAFTAVLLFFGFLRYVPPDSCAVHGRTLSVYSTDGDELWRHRFPRAFEMPAYADPEARARFEDLDGDGKAGLLFEYRPASYRETGTSLYCFSPRGKVKWVFTPKAEVIGRSGRPIPSRYTVEQFGVVKRAGRPVYVAVTSAHLWSFPGLISVLDASGKVVGEYWHAGHVRSLAISDVDGDGNDEILAGGVNNGYQQATILIFDAAKVGGLSDFPAGDQHRIFGRGPGTERAIVRFPRPCFNAKFDQYNWVSSLVAGPKGVEVWVNEGVESGAPTAMYELDRDLNVTGMALSAAFQSRHRDLESRGLLDHSITKEEHDRLKQIAIVRRP